MSAFLGPPAPQTGEMHVGREQFRKSGVAIMGDGTYRRSLNEKHSASTGKKSGDLAGLNAANLDLIGADGKNGRASGLAKLDSVLSCPAENSPADTGTSGRAGHLRESSGTERVDEDAAGPKRGFRLDESEYLGALGDGIVVGIKDLSLNAEFRSGGFRGGGLFHLIVVVLGNQRYQETQLGHSLPPRCKKPQISGVKPERRILISAIDGLVRRISMRRHRQMNQAGEQIYKRAALRSGCP